MTQIFQKRKEAFEQQADIFQKKYNQWAVARAFFFIIYGLLCFYVFQNSNEWIFLGVLVVGIVVFLWMVTKHLNIKSQRDKFRLLATLNNDEILRLQKIFTRPETGEVFLNSNHFYATDLDIFGKHSIFQLLNRTHTFAGSKLLASWLQFPAPYTTIMGRQEASAELKELIDWRQDFEASAMMIEEVEKPTDKLLEWAEASPSKTLDKPLFRYARFLPYLSIPFAIACLIGVVPIQFLLLVFLIHGWILKQIFDELTIYLEHTNRVTGALKAYAVLCNSIAQQPFCSPSLQVLQNQVSEASTSIQHLVKLLERVANRNNPIFMILVGTVSLWDLRYFYRLEQWRIQYQQQLPLWLDTVSEFEALNSLAGHTFANPTAVFPTIHQEDFCLKAIQLGHPMIRSEKRVCNSIILEGIGKTIIITGSNMSGKSTFQRTVGVNMVLALMGAVVCAEAFECSMVQVFTSMRTQDSLEEDTSSFYAELKRLKQLIDWVNQPNQSLPTLYFLDEILKGTNSKDRHDGAKALMVQLHKTPSSGFISTHDVELGDDFTEQGFVSNYSFSSEVINGKLIFDYTLREGVCKSFNASQLMKQIGIDM